MNFNQKEVSMKILNLVHENFEDIELLYPTIRMKEEGADVHLAGQQKGEVFTGKHGVPVKTDVAFEEINPDNYDGLLIPGGWAPDKLRRIEKVLDIVRNFNDQKKPIGIICHAGWVPVSAGIMKGRKATSVSAIKDDMINAGVNWVDEPVVVDGNLVSSRTPADIHLYMVEYIKQFK